MSFTGETRSVFLFHGLKHWCARMRRETGVIPRLVLDHKISDRTIYYYETEPLGPVVKMNRETWKLLELERDRLPSDILRTPAN